MNLQAMTPKTKAFIGIRDWHDPRKDMSVIDLYQQGVAYKDICDILGITDNQLAKEIDQLEKDGLIVKRQPMQFDVDLKASIVIQLQTGLNLKSARQKVQDQTGREVTGATIKNWEKQPKVIEKIKQMEQHNAKQ